MLNKKLFSNLGQQPPPVGRKRPTSLGTPSTRKSVGGGQQQRFRNSSGLSEFFTPTGRLKRGAQLPVAGRSSSPRLPRQASASRQTAASSSAATGAQRSQQQQQRYVTLQNYANLLELIDGLRFQLPTFGLDLCTPFVGRLLFSQIRTTAEVDQATLDDNYPRAGLVPLLPVAPQMHVAFLEWSQLFNGTLSPLLQTLCGGQSRDGMRPVQRNYATTTFVPSRLCKRWDALLTQAAAIAVSSETDAAGSQGSPLAVTGVPVDIGARGELCDDDDDYDDIVGTDGVDGLVEYAVAGGVADSPVTSTSTSRRSSLVVVGGTGMKTCNAVQMPLPVSQGTSSNLVSLKKLLLEFRAAMATRLPFDLVELLSNLETLSSGGVGGGCRVGAGLVSDFGQACDGAIASSNACPCCAFSPMILTRCSFGDTLAPMATWMTGETSGGSHGAARNPGGNGVGGIAVSSKRTTLTAAAGNGDAATTASYSPFQFTFDVSPILCGSMPRDRFLENFVLRHVLPERSPSAGFTSSSSSSSSPFTPLDLRKTSYAASLSFYERVYAVQFALVALVEWLWTRHALTHQLLQGRSPTDFTGPGTTDSIAGPVADEVNAWLTAGPARPPVVIHCSRSLHAILVGVPSVSLSALAARRKFVFQLFN